MNSLRSKISQLEDENSLLKKTLVERDNDLDIVKAELSTAQANRMSLIFPLSHFDFLLYFICSEFIDKF